MAADTNETQSSTDCGTKRTRLQRRIAVSCVVCVFEVFAECLELVRIGGVFFFSFLWSSIEPN